MNLNINKNFKEKAKYILTKTIPFALSGVLIVTSGTIIFNKLNKKNTPEENSIGYMDISSPINLKVKDYNFVILDIGDSKTTGVSVLEKKLKYCNEKNISTGIIVTPTSTISNDIYDNVELVKEIIDKYKIDFPVYFNIDPIIENNDIDSEIKTKVIRMFLDKCAANGMYVGVYGKDTNLVYLKKYCEIVEYDAFVIMDKDKNEIEYDGVYNLYQNNEEKIISKTNMASIIEDKKLNNKHKFLSDGAYIVSSDDNLLEVAMRYNISVNALLDYNEIAEEDFKEGAIIRIPSSFECVMQSTATATNFKTLDEPILGCDMSYSQENINWNEIKENFEFVILRSSFGTMKDETFDKNAIECNINNIPFGIYCFNNCRGIEYNNEELFRKALNTQANSCLEIIANKNVTYPVYFDLEVYDGEDIRQIYSREQIKIMLDLWYEKISASGYIPGLYCNRSTYEYISECYNTNNFEIWIAGGEYYDYEISFDQIEAPTEAFYEYNGQIYDNNMYQYYQYVTNAGASNHEGHLDINYSFVDYSQALSNEDASQYTFQYKDIKRNTIEFPTNTIRGIAIGSGLLGLGYAIGRLSSIKTRKRKKN